MKQGANSWIRKKWPLATWWYVCLMAFLLLPQTIHPERHPLAAWMLFAAVGGLGAILIERAVPVRHRQRILTAVSIGLFALALLATVRYLRAIQPRVGGVDFFYYLCYARDQFFVPDLVSARGYTYFPGVYAFWRTVWRVGDGSLPSFQYAHLLVVALAAVLVGTVVGRSTGQRAAAGFAAVAYVVLASRFQGFMGVTEPLATIPFLLALAIWNGRSLADRDGWTHVIVLGIGLGLTVYAKQQAGLLALGAMALLLDARVQSRRQPLFLLRLGVMPLLAVAVLCLAILLEGRGLQPLVRGLTAAGIYPVTGNWWFNLYAQIRNDESAALASVLAASMWLFFVCRAVGRRRDVPDWLRLTSWLVIGGLATLIQFRTRPFAHYALLGIPCLVAAYTIFVVRVARVLIFVSRNRILATWMTATAAALPLFYTGGNPSNLHVWLVQGPDWHEENMWHERPLVDGDLRALTERLEARPGTLSVWPAYRLEPYFFSGARAPQELGYGFQLPSPEEFPWGEVEYIVIVDEPYDDHPQRKDEYQPRIDELREALPQHGFRVQLQLPTMTLYGR